MWNSLPEIIKKDPSLQTLRNQFFQQNVASSSNKTALEIKSEGSNIKIKAGLNGKHF